MLGKRTASTANVAEIHQQLWPGPGDTTATGPGPGVLQRTMQAGPTGMPGLTVTVLLGPPAEVW